MNKVVFLPLLTGEDIHLAEQTWKEYGVTRRLLLSVLRQSSTELANSIARDEETAEAFLDLIENTGGYIEFLGQETRIMESARARLLLSMKAVVEG